MVKKKSDEPTTDGYLKAEIDPDYALLLQDYETLTPKNKNLIDACLTILVNDENDKDKH